MTKEERLARDMVDGSNYLLFYGAKNEHGYYSNFSSHPITLKNPFTDTYVTYLTAEHRYQAMKATTLEEHEYVRESSTAFESKCRGREVSLRDSWGESYGDLCYYVMLETVLAKFTQHYDLRDYLRCDIDDGTVLYEDSPTDDIWGWRYRDDYRGKNLLGRALMQAGNVLSGFKFV